MIHSRDEKEATANVLQRKGRAELERLLADGNTAQTIAKRARIVLMSADGHGVMAIMREAGTRSPSHGPPKLNPSSPHIGRPKKAMAIVKEGCK